MPVCPSVEQISLCFLHDLRVAYLSIIFRSTPWSAPSLIIYMKRVRLVNCTTRIAACGKSREKSLADASTALSTLGAARASVQVTRMPQDAP